MFIVLSFFTNGVKLVTDPEQIHYQGYDSPTVPVEK
jgi:hypothetical protein